MKTTISNAWICSIKGRSVQPVFGNIILENGKITQIEKVKFEEYRGTAKIKVKNIYDAGGRVVTVPNVNFHEHIYSRLSKGLQINGDTNSFYNILDNLWWKLDRSLDMQMVEASAHMAAAESIKNGVTYLFDHHSSPGFTKGSLHTIAGVLKKNKLRGVLCFETTDRNGTALSQKGLDENIDFFQHGVDENIKSMLGLHASFTVDDSTLQKTAGFVRQNDIGIHIHLCEAPADKQLSKSRFGKLPLQRLIDNNLLNTKSILSHSIYLTAKEYNTIEKFGSAIAINPGSNLNNAVGVNNFKFIPDSVPLLCGTDGMHANPAKSFKLIFLMLRNSGLTFEEAFTKMIKIYFDQINFVKQYFPDYPGLQKNDRADFVIWDYIPPTPFYSNNFWGHYIYGVLESPVHSVVQNGSFLMKDKKLSFIDEPEVCKEIFKAGQKLFKQFKQQELKDREQK